MAVSPEISLRSPFADLSIYYKEAQVPPVGLEPTTFRLRAGCSCPLSYGGEKGGERGFSQSVFDKRMLLLYTNKCHLIHRLSCKSRQTIGDSIVKEQPLIMERFCTSPLPSDIESEYCLKLVLCRAHTTPEAACGNRTHVVGLAVQCLTIRPKPQTDVPQRSSGKDRPINSAIALLP